jgi:hypothetical protein
MLLAAGGCGGGPEAASYVLEGGVEVAVGADGSVTLKDGDRTLISLDGGDPRAPPSRCGTTACSACA